MAPFPLMHNLPRLTLIIDYVDGVILHACKNNFKRVALSYLIVLCAPIHIYHKDGKRKNKLRLQKRMHTHISLPFAKLLAVEKR